MSQLQRALLGALTLLVLVLPAPSQGFRLGSAIDEVLRTPADALGTLPVERPTYDPATRCTKTRRPGIERMLAWLRKNADGVSWGSYRCERWGKGSASLHAEGRAIDWHLDSRVPIQRAAGKRLIRALLATDSTGNRQALARRMGVQELIWDCSYWSAAMDEFRIYRPCFAADGRTRRKRVSATIAHQDHIHIGMTKAGAMARTSFWTRKAPPAALAERQDEDREDIGRPDTALPDEADNGRRPWEADEPATDDEPWPAEDDPLDEDGEGPRATTTPER